MSTTAYKLKADASFPRPIRQSKRSDGETFWEVEGIVYDAGSTISEIDMTENDRERARSGELDHLLEKIETETPEAKEDSAEKKDENLFLKKADSSKETD